MPARTRYAIVGTGSRASMFLEAITQTCADSAELVGLCDLSQVRMDWYNRQLGHLGLAPIPTYRADAFDSMIAERKPQTVIVTTIDAWRHVYIIRALDLGCDVVCEKPLTTTLDHLREIHAAIDRTRRSLRVTFNYRYAPAFTRFRQLMMKGVVGRPLAVDLSWVLDTSHGADYYRRWHREKGNSGGLLVHKSTHHFDLVNWWIDSYPSEVFAMADLLFYGKANAEARGENYAYSRYTGEAAAADDPFALFVDQKAAFSGLYLDAEAETGYIRDRNVFGAPITAEDTMALVARYQNGALLSYNLIAYAPWEGLRVDISGTRGRIEMDVTEKVTHLKSDSASAAASKGPFERTQIRAFPMFDEPYAVDVPAGQGGHGGADPLMLKDIFAENQTDDPLGRAASHIDGAASILVGIAANMSIENGEIVDVAELYDLSG